MRQAQGRPLGGHHDVLVDNRPDDLQRAIGHATVARLGRQQTFFDTFHDLGDPGAAAAYARLALAPHGTLMLVEPRAADDLDTTVATVPTAALGYAASTFLCVPNSLSQDGAAGLGGHAGERRLREILQAAGFTSVRQAAVSPVNMVIEAR